MLEERTTITPVLSSKVGYLEDVRDQVSTIVRFVIMNPGFISSLWEEYLISFRTVSSKYENDRDELANQLMSRVKHSLARMFSDYSFDTDFSVSDYEENVHNGKYTIAFSIMIASIKDNSVTESALIAGTITVDPNSNDISLTYDKSPDTSTL